MFRSYPTSLNVTSEVLQAPVLFYTQVFLWLLNIWSVMALTLQISGLWQCGLPLLCALATQELWQGSLSSLWKSGENLPKWIFFVSAQNMLGYFLCLTTDTISLIIGFCLWPSNVPFFFNSFCASKLRPSSLLFMIEVFFWLEKNTFPHNSLDSSPRQC